MTSPPADEHPTGFGAPSAELERRVERGDGAAGGATGGAHALPLEVPPVEEPGNPVHDRVRYYLCCLEPSGDFDEVIVAVTDAGRRRYFATRDGERLAEVDEDSFVQRSEGGARSLLELDEREVGELEAELQFVRPVRGRDPIAEVADAATDAPADGDGTGDDVTEGDMTEDETEGVLTEPTPEVGRVDDPAGWAVDEESMMEEFEAEMTITTSETVDPGEPIDEALHEPAVVGASVAFTAAATAVQLSASDAIAQVSLAKGIAFIAHRGRLDRSGAPYIDHPGRIAERFDPVTETVEAASAWLHDVLEDSPVTAQELFEAGVMPHIIEVVQLLTRTPDTSPEEYYARIRRSPIARRVKLADIDDNTARWRLRRLEYETQLRLVEKYRVARQALGAD
ncbi:hypothetical protein [Agromyces sp. H66]|uniref:hypothetical protein n=1 Tax=Agromyces sp. H66 TaxID=2529859 RepID=UPI0010AB0483|nr:hypothetical protein [Agromyces sp. H66]